MNENLQSCQRIPFLCELDDCSVWMAVAIPRNRIACVLLLDSARVNNASVRHR